ncbi:MAG: sterol desaturase family protein [Gammaproteobacteria bacterium]
MINPLTAISRYSDIELSWPSIESFELPSYALLLFFIILSAIESYRPKRKWTAKPLKQSYRTNMGFFVLNSLVLSIISASSLYILAERFSHYGLFHGWSNSLLKAALSMILLDLVFYLWHKASHSFDVLWIFHRVHHSDPALNVSTAFRVHMIDLMIATVLKAAYIIALGIESAVVLVYESLMMLFVMFHHTNISFPGEKRLSKLFIVPYLHRVHHSVQRSEHDSNYGAVLSIWDRIFGSLKELEPKDIGIRGESPKTLAGLIRFGFSCIESKTGNAKAPETMLVFKLHSMIAEAAYFKAEQRGFQPGNELFDWLEAESEVLREVRVHPVPAGKEKLRAWVWYCPARRALVH